MFIGVSISPAFAFNIKSSNDLNLINEYNNMDEDEYILQIIRTNKIIEYKIYLTSEEVNNLESLFEKIKTDLNNSKSEEETTQIYNDAAVSLRDFGILPEDISIDEIKQLITGSNRELDKIRFKNEIENGFENRLCFITGRTTRTLSFGPVVLFSLLYFIPTFALVSFLNRIHYNLKISQRPLLNKTYNGILRIIGTSIELMLILVASTVFCKFPVSIGSIMTLGTNEYLPPFYEEDYPAEGWISTMGLNGNRYYNGNLYGKLGKVPFILTNFYIGVKGFTGVNILNTETNEVYYLGFALHVKIDSSV